MSSQDTAEPIHGKKWKMTGGRVGSLGQSFEERASEEHSCFVSLASLSDEFLASRTSEGGTHKLMSYVKSDGEQRSTDEEGESEHREGRELISRDKQREVGEEVLRHLGEEMRDR